MIGGSEKSVGSHKDLDVWRKSMALAGLWKTGSGRMPSFARHSHPQTHYLTAHYLATHYLTVSSQHA